MRAAGETVMEADGLRVVIESAGPAPGGRLSIRGWARHPDLRITGCTLRVTGEGERVYPALFGLERVHEYDASGEVRALKGSFYACGDMGGAGARYHLEFTLEDGSRVSFPVELPFPGRPGKLRRIYGLTRMLGLNPLRKAVFFLARRDLRSLAEYVRLSRESARLAGGSRLLYLGDALDLVLREEPQFPPLAETVDLIIPVHDGLEDLRALVESIRRNTDTPYRLIMVDDCSSDGRVWQYMERIASELQGTVILRNDGNRGFVHSVNRAAGHARNHFVVLNSDVEVPPQWLQRLMAPVFEDARVASATPFTNAGTVCSFPVINEDNPIFAGLPVEEVDRPFRRVKPGRWIDLPTGIGFCMGVNLSAWKELGNFDEEAFSPGYGEENDWCLRAYARGYRNVAVPNLFVYHKSGGTFAPRRRNELLERHVATVFRRYPHYNVMLDIFAKKDPLGPYRELMATLLAGEAGGKAVLLVDHRLGGGAETFRDLLVKEWLRDSRPVLLLTYDRGWGLYRLECLFREHHASFCLRDLEELLPLLEPVGVGEVFYNDLVSFPEPLEAVGFLGETVRRTGAALTVALHDYFPVCPSFNLIAADGFHCGRPDMETCRGCLPRNEFSAYPGCDPDSWRETWEGLLACADSIRCFSRSSGDILEHFYPRLSGRVEVAPHGPAGTGLGKPRLDFGRGLTVGVVGRLSYAKGSNMVVEVARLMEKEMPGAKVVVIGELASRPPLENLEVTGYYRREDLPTG